MVLEKILWHSFNWTLDELFTRVSQHPPADKIMIIVGVLIDVPRKVIRGGVELL